MCTCMLVYRCNDRYDGFPVLEFTFGGEHDLDVGVRGCMNQGDAHAVLHAHVCIRHPPV